MNPSSTYQRTTNETTVDVRLVLSGEQQVTVNTGIGFLDHMLTTLAVHAGWDLQLSCRGDLIVDDHHTVEDTAIALGRCLQEALGDRTSCQRFGFAYAPLDEALSRVVIDLVQRPHAEIHLPLQRETIGQVATENLVHWFRTFAMACQCTLHVDSLRGTNDHHKVESAFKALALSLRTATQPKTISSTTTVKGSLQ